MKPSINLNIFSLFKNMKFINTVKFRAYWILTFISAITFGSTALYSFFMWSHFNYRIIFLLFFTLFLIYFGVLLTIFVSEAKLQVSIKNKLYEITHEDSEYIQLKEVKDNKFVDKDSYYMIEKNKIYNWESKFKPIIDDSDNIKLFKKLNKFIYKHPFWYILICFVIAIMSSLIILVCKM